MDEIYTTDEGTPLSKEDLMFNVAWKIVDLKRDGYTDNEIVIFEDNEMWQEIARKLLFKQ